MSLASTTKAALALFATQSEASTTNIPSRNLGIRASTQTSIFVNITTDVYPSETSFSINRNDATLIGTKPGDFVASKTVYTSKVLLPAAGPYNLTLHDTWGDGLWGTAIVYTTLDDTDVILAIYDGSTESFNHKLVMPFVVPTANIPDTPKVTYSPGEFSDNTILLE